MSKSKRKPRPSAKLSSKARRTQQEQQWAAEDWTRLAVQSIQAGRVGDAIREAGRALRSVPGYVEATLVLAQLLSRRGRLQEARSAVRDGVRIHPREPRLQFVLADVALRCGDLDAAHDAAARFLDLLGEGASLPIPGRVELAAQARRIKRDVERRRAREAKLRAAAPERVTAGGRADESVRVPTGAHQGSLFGTAIATQSTTASTSEPTTPTESVPVPAPAAPPEPRRLVIRVQSETPRSASDWFDAPWSQDIDARELLLESHRLTVFDQYDDLLCLASLRGVERLEYQIETARKILRRLAGRALLCDEVGLGKTIEAGMVIKEYLLRGLVQSVLLLVPPGLVRQWQDEMSQKFDLEFDTWPAGESGAQPQKIELVVGSIALARLERNFARFTEREWDLVVVDEAHHLRRRTSRSWALVNALRKRYILLLSATPVHNNLMELYELATLVKPGLLGTPADFRRRHTDGVDARRARDLERLRESLQEVMVRNTRSHADIALPRRYASTIVLQPHAAEARAYELATEYANIRHRDATTMARLWLRQLLESAGSGPRALAETGARKLGSGTIDPTLFSTAVTPSAETGAGVGGPAATDSEVIARDPGRALLAELVAVAARAPSAKSDRLLELISSSDEQMIVFCRYRATLSELSRRLSESSVSHCVYHGSLPRHEKDATVAAFRSGAQVLLSTESGGEGRNLHFCRTLVNYDLPWDPMRIEQRIGRIHRIGQKRDVFVFNLVVAGTLEEEILRVLEEKLHMFELVVGEIDSVLGHLERREEFADILFDLWVGASDDESRRRAFEAFGAELQAARRSYESERALGDALFADDLEA